jgi:hypothetical protein
VTTHFIAAEIDLQESPIKFKQVIEKTLQEQGEPLRWAVTRVDTVKQTAQVEAVVTVASSTEN